MVENYELMRWKCGVTTAVGTIAYAAVPLHMPVEINPRARTQVRVCTRTPAGRETDTHFTRVLTAVLWPW